MNVFVSGRRFLLLLLCVCVCDCRCEHCKEVEPIYEQVAAAFALDHEKVLVAKIDGSKSIDLAQKYKVQSFPSFVFFPANSSEPDKEGNYDGPRELEDMVEYINVKAGLQRQSNGKLKWEIGAVASLDALLGENGYPPRCMGFPLNATFVETFTKAVETLEGADLEYGTKYYLPAVQKVNEMNR